MTVPTPANLPRVNEEGYPFASPASRRWCSLPWWRAGVLISPDDLSTATIYATADEQGNVQAFFGDPVSGPVDLDLFYKLYPVPFDLIAEIDDGSESGREQTLNIGPSNLTPTLSIADGEILTGLRAERTFFHL